jgi:hypothetical protein
VLACCPASRGCNAVGTGQACALELCTATAAELREAAEAVSRWRIFRKACEHRRNENERRFRRRAYERARDEALIALALHQTLGGEDTGRGLGARSGAAARAT